MEDDQNGESNAILAWILGIAVTIAIAASVIPAVIAAMQSGGASTAAATTGASASTDAPALSGLKLYFESGKADLPATAEAEMASLIAAAKASPAAKVIISGFHDKTGNAEMNAELAKSRAIGVKQALIAAGVGEAQIELLKPQETTGGADDREARRVELTIAQ
jgi:cytochrome c oxidase subunit 2